MVVVVELVVVMAVAVVVVLVMVVAFVVVAVVFIGNVVGSGDSFPLLSLSLAFPEPVRGGLFFKRNKPWWG